MILCIDIDNVCLALNKIWIDCYNDMFDDNLKPEDVKSWNIGDYVKPEAKEEIYKLIESPDLFLAANPVKDSLKYVNLLKDKGNRIVFVTATNFENCKEIWLKEHGFLDNDEDFVQALDKSLIRGNFLLDDNVKNCIEFHERGVLFSQPHNQSSPFVPRANSWKCFYEFLGYKE